MGRFLRIGLVRDGQVLEERLVAMGVDITVGKAPGNTFVVSEGDLPKSSLVLKARGTERHALVFTQPEGRVGLGTGEPSTLAELVRRGIAVRKEQGFVLPLPPTARGKVEIGDVTVLFHYVERELTLGAHHQRGGPRPLVLETVLLWEGTVLAAKSFEPLRTVTLGPGPTCDLQLPGRVLEARAFPIISGAEGRFYVDLRSPHLEIEALETEKKHPDGTRSMEPDEEFEGDRYPMRAPFNMTLALGQGFELELKFAPKMARPMSSPFDIQDPQPILCLAGSAVFHALLMLIAFAIGQSLLSSGEVKAAKAERRRELQAMLQEQRVEEKEAEAEKLNNEKKDEAKDETKKDEAKKDEPKKKEREKPRQADAAAGTPEARRTKLRESVRSKTFLNNLGGAGDGNDGILTVGRETQYADAFQDVASPYAVNGQDGDNMAPSGPNDGNPNGPAYKTLSADERGGNQIDVRTAESTEKGAAEEAAVKVNVRTGQLGEEGGLGKIDNGAVASVFSRRKGAIKACYEKELRRNPDLKGRITLRFTIGTSGRITNIAASQNTTGDDAIASCIIDKVQGWKFEPPSGGAVTFTYPFILEAR